MLNRGEGWDVYSYGGRQNTGLDVVTWARRMAGSTVQEILLPAWCGSTKAEFCS
jgi:cyclase